MHTGWYGKLAELVCTQAGVVNVSNTAELVCTQAGVVNDWNAHRLVWLMSEW